MNPLPQTTLDHYCRLHELAMKDPTHPIDVSHINSACIRAMYKRGLIEYEFRTVNDEKTRRILFTELGLTYRCELMAHVPKSTKNPRQREWVKMQFDVTDRDYKRAYKVVRELIQDDLLAPTVADLLWIHKQAEKGNYKPFYRAYGIPDTKETRQFEGMIQQFAEMQKSLDALLVENQKLREQLQNAPQSHKEAPVGDLQRPQGLRPIAGVKEAPLPVFDDEDDSDLLEVVESTGRGKIASENFLRSLGALVDKE